MHYTPLKLLQNANLFAYMKEMHYLCNKFVNDNNIIPSRWYCKRKIKGVNMPNTQQLRMEDMSVAYVRALCAVNGYSIGSVEHDNDGYDITINCSGCPTDNCKKNSPSIQVQLKSSYAKIHSNNDGTISYALEVDNYKSLIDENRFKPLILIVLQMHEDVNRWIEQTTDYLKITKCAYWKCLAGQPPTDNTETISIRFSAADLLTAGTLKDIMIKVANEQPL